MKWCLCIHKGNKKLSKAGLGLVVVELKCCLGIHNFVGLGFVVVCSHG